MKIRNGFVSNSSSSSFIVKHINFLDETIKKLSKSVISKLLNYGFSEVNAVTPSQLEDVSDKNIYGPIKDGKDILMLNYGYSVICNQDDVVEFLVQNNISFVASIHYGTETYVFDKGSKYVTVYNNFGRHMEIYHDEKCLPTEIMYKIPVKNILKNIKKRKNICQGK